MKLLRSRERGKGVGMGWYSKVLSRDLVRSSVSCQARRCESVTDHESYERLMMRRRRHYTVSGNRYLVTKLCYAFPEKDSTNAQY